MEKKNKKVVFGLTAVFFAVVTIGIYIWGADLCEMYPVPGFATKVEMVKIIGPIATAFSVYFTIK